MIIEIITDVTFESYVNDNILRPLGMENTGIDNNKMVINKMSSPYHSNWEDFIQCEYMDMSSSFSAGAMYSTVDDLYKWDQALYSEKLVSKTTMDLFLQSNVFNYGFPDDHTTVIMLTNYDFVPVFKLTESLTGIRFGEQISVQPRPQSYTLDERIYSNYMWTYEGYGCKATVARNEDQLFFVWNDEAVIPFYPISETTLHHTWHDWECNFTLETDDSKIGSHPANCLMVRIGKHVPLTSVDQFDRIRLQKRFMYE